MSRHPRQIVPPLTEFVVHVIIRIFVFFQVQKSINPIFAFLGQFIGGIWVNLVENIDGFQPKQGSLVAKKVDVLLELVNFF